MIRTLLPASLILSVCALLGGTATAPAQSGGHHGGQAFLDNPQVPDVLRKAIRFGSRARFVGRRTVQFWHDVRNPRYEEIVMRDGPRTRIEFPEGSKFQGQVIVENGQERRHFFPDRNELMITPPRHEDSERRLTRWAKNATEGKVMLTTAPGAWIAGNSTEQVVVADRQGNVEQRLYIEPRTGVLLKRDVYDAGGAKIGSFEFTQVDLNPPPFDASTFHFDRNGVKVVTPYDELRDIAQKNRFPAYSLPRSSGYLLDTVRIAKPHGEEVLAQTYWSRHGKLSLFVLRSQVSPDRLREFAKDEVHASSWQAGGFTFVLVGSLGQNDLDRLAQASANGTR